MRCGSPEHILALRQKEWSYLYKVPVWGDLVS